MPYDKAMSVLFVMLLVILPSCPVIDKCLLFSAAYDCEFYNKGTTIPSLIYSVFIYLFFLEVVSDSTL